MIYTAFVLGAGLGKRLRPLTNDMPKPLLPIAGKPVITYALDRLVEAGAEKIIINTHHHAEKYTEFFKEKKWKNADLIFRHEKILLETGGGIKNTEDLWKEDEDLFVHNGDILTTISLEKLWEHHISSGNEVTLGLRTQEKPRDIGFDEKEGKVRKIQHGAEDNQLKWCLFAGVYAVNRRFLARFEKEKPISVIPVFREMIREEALGGIVLDEGKWHDIGSLEVYERLKNGWNG